MALNQLLSALPVLGTKAASTGFFVLPKAAKSASGGGGGATESASTPTVDYGAELQKLTKQMYEGTFRPTPVEYTAATEEELYAGIVAYLRPGYDAAIEKRREQTKTYGAELDADAVSRGMGSSTYVTDVKSRQRRDEARDIALLETEYGATLAKNLAESLEKQRENRLNVDMFNAKQEREAYALAYEAAGTILSLMGAGASASSGGKRSGGGGGSSSVAAGKTTQANCETFLSSLSKTERAAVYAGTTEKDAAYRDEIIASVGTSGFYKLQGKYSSLP